MFNQISVQLRIIIVIIANIVSTHGLRDVKVTVPKVVQEGKDVTLICSYDLESDILYSIKWYKGIREFYRYTPTQFPAIKTFPFLGINVATSKSNESQVTLQAVTKSVSGNYICEVSADAPSFHTMINSANLEVVDPVLTNGLRDVKVTVPKVVQEGEDVTLICSYDLESDILYSIRWYKDEEEFYRYVPSQFPAFRTFSFPGIHVATSKSNESQVTLQTVTKSVSGKYSCEVSTDAPSFHTMINSANLEVVDSVLTHGLRDVKVTVPKVVQKGEDVTLICSYDMGVDSLYSVKWYKERRDFYRYTPKENLAMKIFLIPGIHVDISKSNESQVTLKTVTKSVSGKYSCEVSADAPSFHTMINSANLEVVEVPEHKPSITGIRPRYQPGETIQGNCTSRNSRPAAQLTWLINDVPASPQQVKSHKPFRNHRNPDLETSVEEINFFVTEQHFLAGKLKIKCTAKIYEIYSQSTEKIIEEEIPRGFSAAATSDMFSPNRGQQVLFNRKVILPIFIVFILKCFNFSL